MSRSPFFWVPFDGLGARRLALRLAVELDDLGLELVERLGRGGRRAAEERKGEVEQPDDLATLDAAGAVGLAVDRRLRELEGLAREEEGDLLGEVEARREEVRAAALLEQRRDGGRGSCARLKPDNPLASQARLRPHLAAATSQGAVATPAGAASPGAALNSEKTYTYHP